MVPPPRFAMASATTSHPSGKLTFGVSVVRCCSLFAIAAASFSFCAAALARNSGEPASVDEILR